MKRISWLIIFSFTIIIFFGATSLTADSKTIYATYVRGFGANNGWINPLDAQGYIGWNDEYWWYHCARKYIDGDNYAYLLKAYNFDQWSDSRSIKRVNAYAKVANEVGGNTKVQFRAYNGSEVIASKIFYVSYYYETPILGIYLPPPAGGWTKEKVDDLQLFIGAKEKNDGYLEVYWFEIEIIFY